MDVKAFASGIERKGQKRKLLHVSFPDDDGGGPSVADLPVHTEALRSCLSAGEKDRASAKRAAHAIAELAKHDEHVDVIVEGGAVDALVPHLSPPTVVDGESVAFEHEVEKDAAFSLGLLAVKAAAAMYFLQWPLLAADNKRLLEKLYDVEPEHQRLIADAGVLPPLIALLKRKPTGPNARIVNGVIRRAADAITNLAHENANIKSRVRTEGGIPPLVELLDSTDNKVQRAVAGALRTLAFKNEQNKNQIVQCGALPTLIFMLRSEDTGIHYEAVGVIGNLVHSSINIKKTVLDEGALQPVLGLLSSKCQESQREAALLLGQFATTDPECKIRIVQRGAIGPLIKMLEAGDAQLREMAAFALGRLAQNTDNQAGIVHDSGLVPLLELLDSRNGNLQHNAAFALYGLADNEDNVSDIIKEGGVQRLMDGELIVQASKDCVQRTLKRLEEKMHGRVLKHLLYLLRSSDLQTKRRVAVALAHLCAEDNQRKIFVDNDGLLVLLEMLGPHESQKQQQDGALALYTLAKKASALSPIDAAPPPPTPQVYLGEQYVNSTTLSDATFMVEGSTFYAHRIALLASSDAFRAMFDGGYREKEAKVIEIPNISRKVFEAMMRCIYTGNVEVTADIAQGLLRAADQYLLEGLKRLCEYAIAQDLTVENVTNVYDLAEAYHAASLRSTCVLFALEHYNEMSSLPGHASFIERMTPDIREYMLTVLRPRP